METQTPTTPASGGTDSAEKAKSPAKQKPSDVPIPPELDVPSFRDVWGKFLQHRSECGGSKYTATAAALQLKKLLPWGIDRAVAATEHSIANGWKGIFEPNNARGNNGSKTNSLGYVSRKPEIQHDGIGLDAITYR